MMTTPEAEGFVQALSAALTTLGMQESDAARIARGAIDTAAGAAERGAEWTRPEETTSRPVLVGAMEAGKVAAMQEVERFSIRAAAGANCDGAVCALACAAGCAVSCGIFGGALIGFGAAGGTIGGSGVTISSTQGAGVDTVRDMSMARFVYSGAGGSAT